MPIEVVYRFERHARRVEGSKRLGRAAILI